MSLILKPEVLTHPNIPKPLHGLSPRELKGQEWWDITRKQVYEEQEYRCIACGVHKSDAKYHKWIEAHESYHIDYRKGSMTVDSIIGLCHSCHNFIHCGRLQMIWHKKEITEAKYFDIMNHGFRVLKGSGLSPNATQANSYLGSLVRAGRKVPEGLAQKAFAIAALEEIPKIQQDWSKWHIVLDGKKYYSKFSSMQEWEMYNE